LKQSPPLRKRPLVLQAKAAYFLSCLGTLSILAGALGTVSNKPSGQLTSGWIAAYSILFLSSLIGVFIGVVFLLTTRRTQNIGRERAYARAAVHVGFLGFISAPLGEAWIESMWDSLKPRQISCIGNVKLVGYSIAMYAQDYDERFPLTENWNEVVTTPYSRTRMILYCPSATNLRAPSYALNALLHGVTVPEMESHINPPPDEPKKIPEIDTLEKVPMIFDSIPGKDQAGGPEMLPNPPRHGETHTVGFLDWHVKAVPQRAINALAWRPVHHSGVEKR
jgi:prepilin-type processing-associated H-X9-DG protein